MVLLLFATEVEILNEQVAVDRDQVLREAAQAYRARSRCYRTKGLAALAAVDEKRVARLEAAAKKLAAKAAKKKPANEGARKKTDAKKKAAEETTTAQIRLVNEWKEPVTVVLSGAAYFLRAGESRKVPKPPGPFTYEVHVRQHWSRGTLEAGKTFTIRIRDR
jgi:hypothetical protein